MAMITDRGSSSVVGWGVRGQQPVGRQTPLGAHPQGLQVGGRLLSEVAKAASRSKGTYLSAQYHRIRGRRGPGKATMAVAHSVLVVAYHILDQGVGYQDLGGDCLQQRRSAEHYQRQLVRQLERLGHKVTLEPSEAA
jgi:hypothetical protein